MTIMEALERAKLLRKAQRESMGTSPDERRPAPLNATSTLAILPEGARVEPEPINFGALERIRFDTDSCERHHVLLSEEKSGDAARADAAYRMLRSRLQHRVRMAKWTCIGITSPGPGEGKTVTTLNLAICVAREKQRPVYLLDLDMRSPSVFEYGGIQPPQSLARYFTGELSAEKVLFETSVGGLVLGGSREPVINASELLATPRLDQLLAYIRRRAPEALIIIDLPPVMSTDEALVVAPRTDALFLVVSEGRTRRDGLRRSVDQLADFNVAGIIVNRSSEHVGSEYYAY
jgi:protein-tyrosine kinase